MKSTVLKVVLPIVAVIAVIAVLIGVFGIAPWIVRGSGPVIEREYPFEDFDRLEVSSAIEFEVTQGAYSISATGYENLIERLEVDLAGRTLRIGLKPGSYFRNNVKAVIALPELSRLVVSGACRGTAEGITAADDLDLEVSGASRLEIDIEAGRVRMDVSGASRITGELTSPNARLTISGASRCELTGSAYDMDLDVSGASRVDLSQFQIQHADVDVSGASQATIHVAGTLNVDVSGASSLRYAGDPVLGRVNVSGASRLDRIN
ncbi:MAG: DUF2807 domain-containing protein [Dehalococcoidia bacterium]|nr:DUF2807 domain-containing protein [Dehalococcoidia bacterium]